MTAAPGPAALPSLSPTFLQARRKIFVATWLVYAGLYFCRKAFYALKPALLEEGLVTLADVGDFGLAYLIAYTLGQWVAGGLGRRVGGRRLLLAGMVLSIVANLAFAGTTRYVAVLVFMVVNGFAQATGWPGCIGVLAQWTRRTERGAKMAVWATCYQLGSIAATWWAARWADAFGWRAAYLAASAVLLGVWALNLMWLRARPADVDLDERELAGAPASDADEGAGTSSRRLWTRDLIVTVLLLGLFYVGVKFIRYALWSWAPVLLWTEFGVTKGDAAYLSTTFDIAGFLGVLTAGFLSDRLFGGRRALLSFLFLLGMLVGCALLATVGKSHVVVFTAVLGLIGFMLFGPDALITGAGAMDLGKGRVAFAAAGIINGMGSIGSVIQELVVSRVLADKEGTATVLALLFGAALLSVSSLALVLWRNQRGVSDV